MCTLWSKGDRGGAFDMMGVSNLLASEFVRVANIKPRHDQAAVDLVGFDDESRR